jgi:hypothetical protein
MTQIRPYIYSILSLIVGVSVAAPVFAQGDTITVSAMTTAMSRNNTSDPSCVREQVGRPFRVYDRPDSWAYDHWPEGCPVNDQVAQFQTWSNSPCSDYLFSWGQGVGDLWEPWCTMLWAEDRTLRMVEVSGCRRAWNPSIDTFGIKVGQWGTCDGYTYDWPDRLPNTPTWDEFQAGATINVTMDWNAANWWGPLSDCGPGCYEPWVFEGQHGFHPMDAILTLRIDYFTDVEPLIEDGHGWFGGWVTMRVEVSRNPNVGNYNRDAVTNVNDIFAFITDWFIGSDRAGACDGVAGCQSMDIFAFLSEWFGGR